MARVLKVGRDQESAEAEFLFEIDYQLSLTTAQRFEMMIRKSRELAEELRKRGHRGTAPVVKRT